MVEVWARVETRARARTRTRTGTRTRTRTRARARYQDPGCPLNGDLVTVDEPRVRSMDEFNVEGDDDHDNDDGGGWYRIKLVNGRVGRTPQSQI